MWLLPIRAILIISCEGAYLSGVFGLVEKPKILCVCDCDSGESCVPECLNNLYEVVVVQDPTQALALLAERKFAGLYVVSEHLNESLQVGRLLQNERILEGMPSGVVLLNADNVIIWGNPRFQQWCGGRNVVGENFFTALGNPEILGPDFCPFHTALVAEQPSSSTLQVGEHIYLEVHAAPVFEPEQPPQHLIVAIRDVTAERVQQQKLAAIHKAGIELANLTAEEVFQMEVDERIELLKSDILHWTEHLLNFDVCEIRLLDQETQLLNPLLSVGLTPDAADRPLRAATKDNGVTGFVAATGKSYLCEDTSEDQLYLEGFKGAKSSLTVPLIWNDQVIGTFNVESPEPRAFTESDLQFLEIFSRDVAVALNTLELLVAQKANAAQQSVEAIHSAVALPVDEILNDAVNVMERYIGHDSEVVERLQNILLNARDIKQVIQKIGQKMAPAEAVPSTVQVEKRPKLTNRRVLVVDADEKVRNDAHARLDRYGCDVETAHKGHEAILMVRYRIPYDAIIADIRLPDMTGYELLVKLQELMDSVPLILMTGFGYDPGHSIVNARRAGLHPKAILYKPFRLDQLLETVETILDVHAKVQKV
jgi:CheY-like chemotaxis protein